MTIAVITIYNSFTNSAIKEPFYYRCDILQRCNKAPYRVIDKVTTQANVYPHFHLAERQATQCCS